MGLFAAGSFDGIYKAIIPWISFSAAREEFMDWCLGHLLGLAKKFVDASEGPKPFDFGLTTS